ncbi:MAG: glycosyltransferase family 4 protein [Steroidobacteraceae bacterium]
MRLLFLNYECPPAGGGAGFATLALSRELVRRGHEVDVLTARAPDTPAIQVVDGVVLRRVRSYRRGIHQVGMGGVLSYLASAAAALPGLARTQKYDAYHYYFGTPTGMLSLLPGAHRRRPYILSLRGSDVPGYEPKLDRWHRLLWPATGRVWRGAAAIIANSAGLRDIAMRTSPGYAIDVIRNGVNAASFAPALAAPRLRIMTTSRLIERKRVDTLLRAVALLPDVPIDLQVAGDGPCLPALKRLAASLGIERSVTFRGFMNQTELARLRAQVDVFVLASASESCSMAVLEAIGASLPVIATRVGGTPEIVRDGQNGLLFEVGDAAGLASALGRLVHERGLRERLANGSSALAQREFSWENAAVRYERLLAAAIAKHTAANGQM